MSKVVICFLILVLCLLSVSTVQSSNHITTSWCVKDSTTEHNVVGARVKCNHEGFTQLYGRASIRSGVGGQFNLKFDRCYEGEEVQLTVSKAGYATKTYTDVIRDSLGKTLWLTRSEYMEPEIEGSLLIIGMVEDASDFSGVEDVRIIIESNDSLGADSTETDFAGRYYWESDKTLLGTQLAFELRKDKYNPRKLRLTLPTGQKIHRFDFQLVPESFRARHCEKAKLVLLGAGAGGIIFAIYYDRVDSSWPWDEGKWWLLGASIASVCVSPFACKLEDIMSWIF